MKDHPNKDICDILVKIGEHERDVSGQVYKFIAFNKASQSLASLDHRVKNGAEAKKLPRIGPKISQIIDVILAGKYDELPIDVSSIISDTEVKQNKSKDDKTKKQDKKKIKNKKKRKKGNKDESSSSTDESNTSEGSSNEEETAVKRVKTTPESSQDKKIEDFYSQMMLSNVDVKHFILVHKLITLSDLKKRQELLTEAQRFCIQNYEDLIKPIPEGEGEKFLSQIKKFFENQSDLSFVLCGDFRRDCEQSSVIDILISDSKINSTDNDYESVAKKKLKMIVKTLCEEKIIIAKLEARKDQFFGLAKLKKINIVRHLRLYWAAKDQYVCRLFSLTGPRSFVGYIQDIAREKNYVLDENSLRKCGITLVLGEPIPLKSEQDLFEYFDLDYVKPQKRK